MELTAAVSTDRDQSELFAQIAGVAQPGLGQNAVHQPRPVADQMVHRLALLEALLQYLITASQSLAKGPYAHTFGAQL